MNALRIDTQLKALEEIRENLAERQRAVYLEIKYSRQGMTSYELSNALSLPINSISGRITELRKLGLIKDSGQRRSNPFSFKLCTVWESTL